MPEATREQEMLDWYKSKEKAWKERKRRVPKPEPEYTAPAYVWMSSRQGTYIKHGTR